MAKGVKPARKVRQTLSHTENRAARTAGGFPSYGRKVVHSDEFFLDAPVPEGGSVITNGTRPPAPVAEEPGTWGAKMVREDRKDPVEILARVSGPGPQGGDSERAYQVWVHFARKAGWSVTENPGFQGLRSGTECGRVEIEGLEYRVHYGLRVRLTLVDDSSGHVTHRPILDYAAWAEPVLEGYTLE